MADEKDPKKGQKKTSDLFSFETDTDGKTFGGGEIPSVTKLLNRKSLTQVLKKAAPTAAPVKPAPKRSAAPRIEVWQPAQLKNSGDPLAKALFFLLQNGVNETVFLSITPPPEGSEIPCFKAKGAFGSAARIALWTGMIWDPQSIPEVWNAVVKVGWIELSPPGSQTNVKSKRNLIRGAFGIEPLEWVTLVRVGPTNQCRGILAMVSNASVLAAIQSQAALLNGAGKA